jgi:hypothetical protein
MDTQAELKLLVEPNNEQERATTSFAKQVLICCGSGVLVMLAVYCTLGTIISAFSLPAETGVLFWTCLISAAVVTITAAFYRGKGLLVLIIPAFILFLLSFSEIVEGCKWVVHDISYQYSRWLPISAVFTETYEPATDPTAFLAAAGAFISLLLGFTICLRRSVFATIAITAPFVFLTFVITNLSSDLIYLLGLISVYLTLLISGTVKPDSFAKRGIIVIPSFIIAIVFMFIAYFLAPHEQYSREEQIAALSSRVRAIASQMGRFGQYWQTYGTGAWDMGWLGRLDIGLWQFNTSNVSIADAGNRSPTYQSLLEITSDKAGTFYLRGYSMQSFNGRSWISPEIIPDELDFTARRMPATIAYLYSIFTEDDELSAGVQTYNAQMTITRTGDITPRIIYEPYYSSNHIGINTFHPGIIDAAEQNFSFFHIEGNVHSFAERMRLEEFNYLESIHFGESVRFPGNSSIFPIDALHAYANVLSLLGVYTEIDSNTAQGLRQIAIDAGIDPDADRTAIADAVARFVRSAGRYTLSPEKTPEYEDFALYFLQELKEGYCIHFATVAVLMLRSLDVPARFTSGYVVSVAPGEVGQTIEITDLNAHAWVEVFYDDIGWLYLEATPPGGGLSLPDPRPHTPPLDAGAQESPDTIPENDISDNPSAWDFGPDNINNGNIPDAGTGDVSGTGNNTQQETDSSVPFEIPRIAIYIAYIALAILAIIARSKIMFRTREKRFMQANSNKAVLYMWRYIKRLGRSEVVIPNDIEELALKARFSQHRMTEDERAAMASYTNRLAFEISSGKNEYGRLWLKYIRALC